MAALKLLVKGKGYVRWQEGNTTFMSNLNIYDHECPLTLPGKPVSVVGKIETSLVDFL
jgi:hypothetical protein